MILVYITCESQAQAEDIGRHLLKKRLAGCINIIPGMRSAYLWPPGKNYIEEADEVILLCKTIEKHYKAIEKEVLKLHTYSNPAIFALPILHVSKNYANWLKSEIVSRKTQRKLKQSSRQSFYEAMEKISRMPNKPMGELSEEDKIIYGED